MNICVVGAFGFKDIDKATGGQPVKTRELYYALCEKYYAENVNFVETYGWKKAPIKALWNLMVNVGKSDTIIMLPAHNGVRVFSRLLLLIKRRKSKLFYDVIGGWLPEKIKEDTRLKKSLEKFNGIWVETTSMKTALNELGIRNVTVIPNFKKLTVLLPNELVYNNAPPYPLCTFSRIMKEKGIEDAVNAVKQLNTKYGETVFTLDLYGQVDNGYKERFDELSAQFPDYIRYMGVVSPNQSVETLKSYFALLFPTHYYTEGVPGTLIDACAAGVPVVAALWKNSRDVFENGKTGWDYEFDNYEKLIEVLEKIHDAPKDFEKMKSTCLQWAEKYRPETVMCQIDELLRQKG